MSSITTAHDGAGSDENLTFFENEIRPLLIDKCVKCHGPKKQKGGLRLDSPGGILAGGEGGSVLNPGDANGSRLIEAVRYLDEDLQMPPRKKLDAHQISALERWVTAGADLPKSDGVQTEHAGFDLAARMEHWSFQSLTDPVVPLSSSLWPRDDVDRFLLDRLQREGLLPAPEGAPGDWLRRVHFTLIGLPPDAETVRRFAEDSSAEAREAVVDELLASPHFGERWGRHWLDLVRYAETRGHEFDYAIPNARQYRDYIVRAFNSGVPFDRLVQEHIAGDLLETPRMSADGHFDESILGTGFWFLGDGVHSPVDIRADETDRVANQVDVFSRAFLGLTVACARCHDHKFDPITAEDFYALSGFVMGGSYRQARFETLGTEKRTARRLSYLQERHRGVLTDAIQNAFVQATESRAPYQEHARKYVANLAWPEEEDQEAPVPDLEEIAKLAAEHDLNPADLQAWVDEWITARDHDTHPLHTAHATEDGSTQEGLSEADPSSLFHDQGDGQDGDKGPRLMQDGFTAGTSTLPQGTLLLGSDPASAVTGMLPKEAVHFDGFWNRMQSADGDEGEATATSGILPGRMFRTKTFELTEPDLHVLVRGQGFIYAAVDGHRIVKGPLHGAICKSVDTRGPFEWVHLNLADYVRHRLHLEFSPRQDSQPSFAVAGYRQGAVAHSRLAWSSTSFSKAARSLDSLADASDADRGLVDWMLQRPHLFPIRTPEYVEASANYNRDLEALAEDQTWVSHTAPVMLEGSGVDEFVLLRGNAATPGNVATRRFLEALGGKEDAAVRHGSGRLELAQRVTSAGNPFLPRVWANRLWHHVFGRGIVASVDDFGVMGTDPSHPELLDYLAQELRESGWSTKAILRRLVLSRAYSMSSTTNTDAQELDPNNFLLHRMGVQRLDAEALRDTILAVSGTLDRTLFGPSVPVHLTPFTDGRGKPGTSGPADGAGRRSLYLSVRRNFPVPFLSVFDFPNPAATMGRRGNSNVPAQALTLLNDPFVQEEAKRWAARVLASEDLEGSEQRLASLYVTAFGREPTAVESSASLDYVQAREASGANTDEVWAELCHVLINTKEFRYLR